MSYKTLRGSAVCYEFAFIGKPVADWTEQDKELVSKYKECFIALQYAEQELISKRAEVLKLQHENDFMQRLIDKHMIGE